jgi:hypothetical protein
LGILPYEVKSMFHMLAALLLVLATAIQGPGTPVPGKIAFVREGALWLYEAGQERTLIPAGPVSRPRISPSGRYVSYTMRGVTFVVPTAGGDPWPIPGVYGAQWAPAEDTLAVNTRDGVAVVPVSEQGVRAPAVIARGWSGTAWSPDGRAIAVARGERTNTPLRGSVTLAVVNRSGGEPRPVITEAYSQQFPAGGISPLAWSPDGRWILYFRRGLPGASIAADYNELAVVPAAGGEATKVAETPNPAWFDWAPAAATLAVTDGPGRMAWQNKAVRVTPMPPRAPYWSPTPPGYADREPAWAQSGQWLAFTRSRTEFTGNMNQPQPEQQIMIADPASGRTFEARGSEGGVAPQWGPADSLLWVRPDQQTVWYLPKPDAEPVAVIRNLSLTSSYYGQWPVSQVLDWWVPTPSQ